MNDSLPTTGGSAPSGVSRRTVMKGAAWSMPVMAIGAPVLAITASGLPEAGDVCRENNDAYRIYIDPVLLKIGTTFTLVLSDPDVIRDVDPGVLVFSGVGFTIQTPTISPDGLTYIVTVAKIDTPLTVSPYLYVENGNLTCSLTNDLSIRITQSGTGEQWKMDACYDNCNKLGW